jgi:hypothetical protein
MSNKKSVKQILLFLLIWGLVPFLISTECEDTTLYQFQKKLVVNAQLVAGQPLDTVYVTWSAQITERYDTFQQRVQNAEVKLNGIRLEEVSYIPGAYIYPDRYAKVVSGKTYRLEVWKDTEQVFSETTVPPPFHFSSTDVSPGDTVKYVAGTSWISPQFFLLEWTGYKFSKIFRISSLALNPTDTNFINDERTEANIFKGQKEDRENPTIWWVAESYARINWMYFNWIGSHQIVIAAMDENYYKYRSGLLFGEQSGQNFNTVVQNGYGLFASSANDTINIFIVK